MGVAYVDRGPGHDAFTRSDVRLAEIEAVIAAYGLAEALAAAGEEPASGAAAA